MTITHDWHITDLERETSDGFIFLAHWTVSASEPTGTPGRFYTASSYGTAILERPQNLIPYESLTEETVIGWVKEKLSELPDNETSDEPQKSKLQAIEESLQAQIQQQKSPKIAAGTPWQIKADMPPADE